MNKYFFMVIGLIVGAFSFANEQKLTGEWTFRFDNEEKAVKVEIPHTWNAEDSIDGVKGYRQDVGVYNCEFNMVVNPGKRYFLRFDAVNESSEITINGEKVYSNEGGYNAFAFEITDIVVSGKNKMIVKADNRYNENIMPLTGDFNFCGGIYRDVWLIEKEKISISPIDYASSGVYFTQETNKDLAKFSVKTLLLSDNPNATVRVSISDAEGKVLFTDNSGIEKADFDNADYYSVINGEISNPRLWNSVRDPYLYSMKVETLVSGKVTDVQEEKIGFRFFSVDPKQGFSLNGEQFKIQGVCRHQDKEGKGFALSNEDHDLDFEIMREMGVNSVRFSHYPHAKYVYQLADRNGIVAYAEIPFVGPGGYSPVGFNDSEEFKANGKEQLIAMIKQNFNHPSIIFWGLYNELNRQGNEPYGYLAELNALVKELDPARITVGATNVEEEYLKITDVVAYNLYWGWYGGEPRWIGPVLDGYKKKFPNRNLGISEYGAGGSPKHHTEKDFAPVPTSKFHPENWQAKFHEDHWKAISRRDFVWGTYVWNMFDFASHHRTEGDRDEINDKGLVSHDRKVKKDAFYFYKANWNKEDKFVHIANRRFTENRATFVRVKIYSNLPQVRIKVNGKEKIVKTNNGIGIFEWKPVLLSKGENKIEAFGLANGEIVAQDSCTWNR